jgi:hypothetical protein
MVDTVKSASITTLDGTTSQPPASTQLTTGKGAAGVARIINDYVSATAAGLASTSSTYKAVRLPSQAMLKTLEISSIVGLDSSTGLQIDVGAYYSDSTVDNTQPSLQGVLISANCFAAAVNFANSSVGQKLDGLQSLDPNLRTSALWQQVGLSADPGGYIDIVLAVHTAKSGTASPGNINVSAIFVD